MSQLIDELAPRTDGDATLTSPASRTAIREHDRFLVATHENPDGDALGSLLATTLGAAALGKDVVMFLSGTCRCRPSTGSCRSTNSSASAGRHRRARAGGGRLRERAAASAAERPCSSGAARRRHRPPPRQHALRPRELIVADASSTGGDHARPARRARRDADAARSPSRSTSRSSPTRGASSTRTRRRRRCGSPPSWSRRASTCSACSAASTSRSSSRS